MKSTHIAFILLSFVTFTACDPETQEKVQEKLESIDGFEAGNAALRGELQTGEDALAAVREKPLRPELECAAVSHDTSTQTITLDFGTSPCIGADGKSRSGILQIVYGGNFKNPDKYRQLIFKNFKSDTIVLNGYFTYDPIEKNGTGNVTISVKADSINLAFDNGNTFSFDMDRTWTWTEGMASSDPTDDVYEVTGTTTGLNFRDNDFSMDITQPLVYKTTCWSSSIYYAAQGSLEAKENRKTFVVDYGSGVCDKEITVTVGNQTDVVLLP